ncbi:hypothetical protein OED01_04970 [Microbacterium sp. M28]|nr:hypothetical protein [Microbacterium sp. M28]UYO98068.1 hypothetical protein OED01_04970 [Microbacterium sp. M28]
MSDPQTPEATTAAQPLVSPIGLDLLGDTDAGACSGGFCVLPTEK